MLGHSIDVTIVSTEIVVDGTAVLVEFNDGALKQYALQAPLARSNKTATLLYGPWPQEQFERQLRWKTVKQIVEEIREYNADCRVAAANAHHQAQVQRLGWDYRQRGYR